MHQTLKALHNAYCSATGQQPPYATCERRWFEFVQADLNQTDLLLVISWIKVQNKKNDYQYSLRIDKLLDLEHFGSLLGEARAWQRKRQALGDPNKRQALKEFTSREPETTTEIKLIRDVCRRALNNET